MGILINKDSFKQMLIPRQTDRGIFLHCHIGAGAPRNLFFANATNSCVSQLVSLFASTHESRKKHKKSYKNNADYGKIKAVCKKNHFDYAGG